MNWEAIGAIGEILGAVCVIFTLFYLGLQLRQNTAQVRHSAMATEISAYQDMIGRISDLNTVRILNPGVASMITTGNQDPDDLSPDNRTSYFTWIVTLLRNGDMAFLLYERGIIDYERTVSSMGPLLPTLGGKGFTQVWESMKVTSAFTSSYVDFIDRLILEQSDYPSVKFTETGKD